MKEPLFTRAFVLAACATSMLSLAGFLFVHLPGFLQQLGAGEAEIGRIMAAQALGAVIAWPLVGQVMDARGRCVMILGGCVLFIVTITLYLFIDSLGPFVYLVRLLDGVAHTMWYTALFTYGADLVPAQRRTHGLAIFGTAGLITIGLGAQFGDVILAYANYRELFFGALGFAVIGLLMCLPLRDVLVTHGDASLPSRGIFAAATQWNLLPMWCASVAFFVSMQGLFAFLKTFISTVNIGSVGSFCIAYATIAVALRVFLGWVPDRLGTRRMLGIAMSSYALGFTVLSAAQTPVHVLVAGLLCGTGHGYTYPVLFSLVVERAEPRQRGSAMAFFTMIDWLGLLIAGPVFGYVIELAGYGVAFVSLALLLASGLGLFYGIDRLKRSPRL
ncbi:MAG: MFS transporter [Gammaproteobacteria bacterium]